MLSIVGQKSNVHQNKSNILFRYKKKLIGCCVEGVGPLCYFGVNYRCRDDKPAIYRCINDDFLSIKRIKFWLTSPGCLADLSIVIII